MDSNFTFKYYRPERLILLILILAIGVNHLMGILFDFLETWKVDLQIAPTSILVGGIIIFIDKKLHHWNWGWRRLMKAPLIRGSYRGKLYFTLDDAPQQKEAKLVICQTGSKIKVNCYFWPKGHEESVYNHTKSSSILEEININPNDIPELHFYYRSIGVNGEIREGFNVLNYHENKKILKGHYFSRNSYSLGNGGHIEVEKYTKNLNHLING